MFKLSRGGGGGGSTCLSHILLTFYPAFSLTMDVQFEDTLAEVAKGSSHLPLSRESSTGIWHKCDYYVARSPLRKEYWPSSFHTPGKSFGYTRALLEGLR